MALVKHNSQKPRIFVPNRHPIRKGIILDIPYLEKSLSGTARNLASNKLDGSYNGTLSTQGGGLQYGSGGRTEVSHNAAFNVSTGLTIETLLRLDLNDSAIDNLQIVKKDTQYIFRINDTARFRCFIWTSTGQKEINYSGLTPALGDWYHLAYTYDTATTTMKLYINGAFVDSNTNATGTPSTTGNTIGIGAAPGGGESVAHLSMYLRMWERELKSDEVQQLYTDPWVLYRKQTLTLPNVDLFSKLGNSAPATVVKDLLGSGIVVFPR